MNSGHHSVLRTVATSLDSALPIPRIVAPSIRNAEFPPPHQGQFPAVRSRRRQAQFFSPSLLQKSAVL